MCSPTTKRNRHKSNRCGRAYVNHYNYSKVDYNRDLQVEVTVDETEVKMKPEVETPEVHAKVTEHQDYSRSNYHYYEETDQSQDSEWGSMLKVTTGVVLMGAAIILGCKVSPTIKKGVIKTLVGTLSLIKL